MLKLKPNEASAIVALTLCAAAPAGVTLTKIGAIPVPGAEIVSFDPAARRLLIAGELGVTFADLEQGDPAIVRTFNLAEACGFNTPRGASVSHVAVDPLGRGFGAASIIPADKAGMAGQVVLFCLRTGDPLCALWTGFCPDAVAFTPDGSAIVVADEGEPVVVRAQGAEQIVDPPGGVSLIDLAHIRTTDDARSLDQSRVATLPLDSDAARTLIRQSEERREGLRISPRCAGEPGRDLEPESIAIVNGTALFTLQENNALAEFDLASRSWTRIAGLGARTVRIDASDRDAGARIDDLVHALPTPDQLALAVIGAAPFLVTCDEGDDRGDPAETPLGDVQRLATLGARGSLDPGSARALDLSPAGLGRLKVCAFSGDTDGDGDIDTPTLIGSRSVSVWDARTLSLVGHTGDQIERWIAAHHPARFNAGLDGAPDDRSDDRGPEPEGIAIGEAGGRSIAFVTLERPGAIALIDLTTPSAPEVIHIHDSAAQGDLGPEGATWIPAALSPVAGPLLVVAYEGSGTVAVYRIDAE